MKSAIALIITNKRVDSGDLNNYRPVASLVAAMSNIFEFNCTFSILEQLLTTNTHYCPLLTTTN